MYKNFHIIIDTERNVKLISFVVQGRSLAMRQIPTSNITLFQAVLGITLIKDVLLLIYSAIDVF